MLRGWKCHLWHVSKQFTDQYIIPMELNFEGLEIQK